jgi:Spy/CpxP family protein refolding chaperone
MTRTLKWRIAIGFLLVFLAGAATGVFAGAWHARNTFRGRHGVMMGDHMREHLVRHLNLTPEQTRELDPIFDRTAKELHTIRQETRSACRKQWRRRTATSRRTSRRSNRRRSRR